MPVYNNDFAPRFPITNGQLADVTFYTADHKAHTTVGIYAPAVVTGCTEDQYPLLLDDVIRHKRHLIPNATLILSSWQQAIFGQDHKFSVGVCVQMAADPLVPEATTVKFRQYEINKDMRPGGLANDDGLAEE